MSTTSAPQPFVLRDLSLTARVVIAAFLVSVAVGYFSALVQLHFQAASPGELLPGALETKDMYHGRAVMSQLERLITTHESRAFNGSGSMRSAFTTRSTGWAGAIDKKARQAKLNPDRKRDLQEAEKLLRAERYGEAAALVAWMRGGKGVKPMDKQAYEDGLPVPPLLARHPITPKFVTEDNGVKKFLIQEILAVRCVRCHSKDKEGPASEAPLDTYEEVVSYGKVQTAGAGMSLRKLAQTTHVHLLGFAMLYGLTGFIFCFTSYPGWFKAVLAPLPLVVQVLEICIGWWGGRAYEPLALAIPILGGFIALTLFLQIVCTLFNLFGKGGKVAVLVLLVAAAVGIAGLKVYIMDPYLEAERLDAAQSRPVVDQDDE